MICMDLGDRNLAIGAQATRDVDHHRGYIKMKRGFQSPKRHPLGERFQVVDRFDGLNLNYRHDFAAAVGRGKDDIGIHRGRARAHGGVLL